VPTWSLSDSLDRAMEFQQGTQFKWVMAIVFAVLCVVVAVMLVVVLFLLVSEQWRRTRARL
jgi:ABC-type spermidine/putrescine transport system permease subunit I